MKKILYLFTSFVVLSSCSNFVDIGEPNDRIVAGTVFLEEGTALAAINGLYEKVADQSLPFTCGGTTIYLGLYSDELASNYPVTSTVYTDFINGKIAENNSAITTNFWRNAYVMIYQANSIIKGLENSPLNTTLKNQLSGEAYFIRAYCYWYLQSMFGSVPLVLDPNDYEANAIMPRTPASEVHARVMADLQEAKNRVGKTYPSTGKYRVNYYTVLAFLSRIYTNEGNWQGAYDTANEIITANVYKLETSLNNIFLTTSTEVIWQTAADAIKWTTEANYFIPTTLATARPNMPLTTQLLGAFETGDQRRANWVASKTVSGVTWYYPYKYKVRTLGSTGVRTESLSMFRLGEVYLNFAEAKAHLNDATAKDDLNQIRNRAGLGSISPTGTALTDAILRERRIELFAEWGMRFFDLRRTGQLDAVNGAIKPNWTSNGKLFPIPYAEIRSNPQLTQNPGYNQ